MNLPKKELGQHWLHDEGILQAIAEAGAVNAKDNVLEIGPGLGTLTEILADTGADITALEFDNDLLRGLRTKFNNCNNVAIIEGDIRKFNFSDMPNDYKIIANIPYYLTSHLIRSISETPNPPSIAVLLVQKEVAERICASPGSLSILGITAQFYFDCQLDIEVPAALFTPPPKIDSQVVVMQKRAKKLLDVDEQKFFHLVKAGFSGKRKTLRNSLSGGLRIPKIESENLLKSADVESGLRAQELSFEQWNSLYLKYDRA